MENMGEMLNWDHLATVGGSVLVFALAVLIWYKSAGRIYRFKKTDLGGGVGSVLIPENFHTAWEGKNTLLCYPYTGGLITLRFSTIPLSGEKQTGNAAKKHIEEKAKKEKLNLEQSENLAYISYSEKPVSDDGRQLLVQFWEVGSFNTLVIVSATIAYDKQKHRLVVSVLNSMPKIIASIEVKKTAPV